LSPSYVICCFSWRSFSNCTAFAIFEP